MKEPHHRPSAAFEKARDQDEQTHQQRIAALSRGQRQAFDVLTWQQSRKEQELGKAQAQRFPQEVADRMRHGLLKDHAPELKPGAQGTRVNSPELERAITDAAGGRGAQADNRYRIEVSRAHGEAQRTVSHQHAQEKERLRETHQRERDSFLTHAERSRGASVKENFREAAQRQRPSQAFNRAAQDPSFRRAFDSVARKEAERERGHDRTLKETFREKAEPQERNTDSFNKAARDPSLQRAFERAARTDPDNRDGPNHDPRDGPGMNR